MSDSINKIWFPKLDEHNDHIGYEEYVVYQNNGEENMVKTGNFIPGMGVFDIPTVH